MWLIELSGDQADIEELKKLAPHCECEIAPAHDGREYLSGRRFEDLSSAEEVSATAIKVLTLLNGIARVGWSQFRSVQVAGVSQMRPDGTKAAFVRAHFAIRPRVSVNAVVIRADGTVEQVIAPDLGSARAKQIIADPRLCEIAKAIAGEITWQRLRVAVEKFGALITGKAAKGSWPNALVRYGYATPDEVGRFKANIEDPRLSGLNASCVPWSGVGAVGK